MSDEQHTKWQPMMLILDQRLECTTCGALAIFLTGKVSTSEKNILDQADALCFECFRREQQEGDEPDGRQTE